LGNFKEKSPLSAGIFDPTILSSPTPYILEETAAYAVVYKPPRWHSAPRERESPPDPSARILLFWYARRCPAVLAVRGRTVKDRKVPDGGLLHRLDYETQGLVLFAKHAGAMEALLRQQREGLFIKEYGALSRGNREELPGFPPAPIGGPAPFTIASAFRPFGPGRRAVRPVAPANDGKVQKKTARELATDQGEPYKTEVPEMSRRGDLVYFRLRISRGFRHQIRCHLAWLGYAICNDKTYGGGSFGDGTLALRAAGISFYDPESNTPRDYRLVPPDKGGIYPG
jgi:23S rRNA pseudouridine1911/1915/1917 synthase